MYVILVNEDNSLVATNKERIMQRSKLVDTLWFLVAPEYKGYDMAKFTVLLEYLLPISKKYHSEILSLSDEKYNGYLKYHVPFDTCLTSEVGSVEVQITFAMADLDSAGNAIQRVRKTSSILIDIIPITAWSDIIPDSALSALDQRLIKLDAQMRGMNEYMDAIENSKVDNLVYDKEAEALQLCSNGVSVGDKVYIKDMLEDGTPVIDLGSASTNNSDKNDNFVGFDDVVEF